MADTKAPRWGPLSLRGDYTEHVHIDLGEVLLGRADMQRLTMTPIPEKEPSSE